MQWYHADPGKRHGLDALLLSRFLTETSKLELSLSTTLLIFLFSEGLVSMICVGAQGGKEKVSDHLEVELWGVTGSCELPWRC